MTKNKKLLAWVDEMAKMCQPDNIHWCDGSQQEYDRLAKQMVQSGTFIPLDEKSLAALGVIKMYAPLGP